VTDTNFHESSTQKNACRVSRSNIRCSFLAVFDGSLEQEGIKLYSTHLYRKWVSTTGFVKILSMKSISLLPYCILANSSCIYTSFQPCMYVKNDERGYQSRSYISGHIWSWNPNPNSIASPFLGGHFKRQLNANFTVFTKNFYCCPSFYFGDNTQSWNSSRVWCLQEWEKLCEHEQ
jgi:hypothetical protein